MIAKHARKSRTNKAKNRRGARPKYGSGWKGLVLAIFDGDAAKARKLFPSTLA
jgi:hypothetical protein